VSLTDIDTARQRAHDLASKAPRRVTRREQIRRRRSFPGEVVTWAVEGPRALAELLDEVAKRRDQVRADERTARQREKRARDLRAQLEATFSDEGERDAFIAAFDVLGDDGDADVLAHQVASARAMLHARKKISSLERRNKKNEAALARAPQKRAQQVKKLEDQLAATSEELAVATKRTDQLRAEAVGCSAEREHVEHQVQEAAELLSQLKNEARSLLAAVEEDHPGEARRLYHHLGEATDYVEYRREAEAAQQRAAAMEADLEQQRGQLQEANWQIEQLQIEVSSLETERYALQEQLTQAGHDLRQMIDANDELHEQATTLNRSLEHASAWGTPVTVLQDGRIVAPLLQHGVCTLGELSNMSREEVIDNVTGIGGELANRIERELERYGLYMR
jgi:DNA repair exonuclease SbcCD ATPase subunit